MKKTFPQEPPNPEPRELDLTGTLTIEAAAALAEGQPVRNRRFTMVAYTGGAMRIAGFSYPVVVDMSGLDLARSSWPIFVGHSQDIDDLLGQTDRVEVLGANLVASGEVIGTSPRAQRVVEANDKGFKWQASIGAAVLQREFVPEGRNANVNGSNFQGPVIIARRAELGEISFVFVGADRNTSATIAAGKTARENQVMDENRNGTEVVEGTSRQGEASNIDGQAVAGTEAGAPAIQASATPPANDLVADMRTRAAAEQERISAVRKICGDEHAGIAAQAIRDGWDTTRTELEILRASRPKAPAAHVPDNSMDGTVLEAACMLTAGLTDLEQLHDEKTLDAASKRFRGGIGLQELLLEAAWANGYTGRNFRDSRSVLRFAFGHDVQAGFSSVDIGGILSNVANKFLLEGFFSVERTWRNICAVRNVSDFKTVTSYRLIGTDQYELVAPGGELKHGTLGNETYTNKADTYGLMLSVDRRDMINDDLGAITTVPRKLGRGSGLKINDVFWTTFLANSSFFTAGAKNYFTGTDTALSVDGLTKAETAFMDQLDTDGKPIGIQPAVMLVPTALSAIATMLFKSLEIRDTTASTKAPTANPHQGKFRTEVSRYLSNSRYTGNSAKAWYLL
ncbi:MAG: hypothetical protein NT031_05665, partial [Planctomycetota bacterium]|nr:hypothetical protein [Planctomycetota bacterium]